MKYINNQNKPSPSQFLFLHLQRPNTLPIPELKVKNVKIADAVPTILFTLMINATIPLISTYLL